MSLATASAIGGLGMTAFGTFRQYQAGKDAARAQNAANAEQSRIARETNALRQQQVEFQRQQMEISRAQRDFENQRQRQLAARATRARVANAIAAGVAGGGSPGSAGSATLNAVAGQRANLADVLGQQSRRMSATRQQEVLGDSIFNLGQQMAAVQTQGAQNLTGYNQQLANATARGSSGSSMASFGNTIFGNQGVRTLGKLWG